MRKLYLVLLVFALSAGIALAGSYTFTTTAAEDTVISRLRTFANTNNLFGATPAAPYTTDTLFINAMCRQKVLEVRDTARAQSQSFEDAWASSSVATRDGICSTLGLSAGCKP